MVQNATLLKNHLTMLKTSQKSKYDKKRANGAQKHTKTIEN